MPASVKKIAPIIISALILYYFFHDQKWNELLDAIFKADLALALLAVFIPQLIFWFVHVLFLERTLKWFHAPVDYRAFFWARGAIYILQFINTALSGGGLLIYQQRKTGITWRKLLGIELFRFGMSMWGITFVMIAATVALHYYGLADKVRINIYAWWGFLILPGAMFCISTWHFWFNNYDSLRLGRLIVRDRRSEFWTAFRIATRKQWLISMIMMLPPFILTLLGLYVLAISFHLNIPFWEFIVLSPLMLLIIDLPIAFAGFGTTTLAWITFFGDGGMPDNVAALTLFLPFARGLCRSIIGLISLPPALRDLNTLIQPVNGSTAIPEGVVAEEAVVD